MLSLSPRCNPRFRFNYRLNQQYHRAKSLNHKAGSVNNFGDLPSAPMAANEGSKPAPILENHAMDCKNQPQTTPNPRPQLLWAASLTLLLIAIIGCGGSGGSGSGGLTTSTSSSSGSGSSGTSSGSTSSTGSTSGQTGSGSTSGSTSSGGSTGSSTGSSGGSGVKPILKGLVTMGNEDFVSTGAPPQNQMEEINAHPGVYSGAVIELQWSQLEPQEGVFDDSSLVSALSTIQAYNALYPATPVVAKLRIFAGRGTPNWVIQNTGGVSITDSNGNSLTVGKFWTTQYQSYWRGLQNHLASEYDSNPLIGEVAISSGCTLTAEPFILPLASMSALH